MATLACAKCHGRTIMRFFNPIFKTQKVKRFIADLIVDYDYDRYSDLTYSDKCEFAALLIEASGKNSEHECLVESNDLDQLMGALKKSLSGTHEDDENLLFTLKENTVNYFDRTMEELFDDGFENFQQDRREWIDYVAKNGDPDEAYDRYRESL